MRIYISGPMRGKPLNNYPAFDDCSERIRSLGHTAISPADLDRDYPADPTNLSLIVERDIKALLTCDAIAMLPGWQHSVGAKAELAVARFKQLKVLGAASLQEMNADVVGIIMPFAPKLVDYGNDNAVFPRP